MTESFGLEHGVDYVDYSGFETANLQNRAQELDTFAYVQKLTRKSLAGGKFQLLYAIIE